VRDSACTLHFFGCAKVLDEVRAPDENASGSYVVIFASRRGLICPQRGKMSKVDGQ
jgi:hypothetical protein